MTEEEKNRLIQIKIAKAEESYQTGDEILADHPTFAVNRYYYSLFYAVSALLLHYDTPVRTHKGVVTEFNKQCVKTGIFTREEGRLFAKVFQWRNRGDYDDFTEFTQEDVESIRLPVREFIDKLKDLLE